MKFVTVACASVALMLSVVPVAADFAYGLPWGADGRWAHSMTEKGTVSWYHHWEMGMIEEMPKHVEYVPTLWGPKKMKHWGNRKAEIEKHKLTHILSFNEPDVPGQANMDVDDAVNLHMKELEPFVKKGLRISSPQLVWDFDWLKKFMHKCKAAGCNVHYIALHWYGSADDFDKFQSWVTRVYHEFKLPIWITEFGLTSASNPSEHSVENFIRTASDWISKQEYIERAAWNGCYAVDNPPDSFATPLTAFFHGGGALRKTAQIWLEGKGNRKLEVENSHTTLDFIGKMIESFQKFQKKEAHKHSHKGMRRMVKRIAEGN